MQVLFVYANQDAYSYDGFHLHRSCFEGDYSKADLGNIKRDYRSSFAKKTINKLSITHIDVSPTGEVTILDNVQGEHPLKTRKEINPAAVQAKAARKAKAMTDFIKEAPLPPHPGLWTTIDESSEVGAA